VGKTFRLIAGFTAGCALGIVARRFDTPALAWTMANVLNPVSQLFLRIIFSAVVPLIFSSLVLAIFEMNDLRSLKRIAVKGLVFTLMACTTAVAIGFALTKWMAPGENFNPDLLKFVQQSSFEGTHHVVSQVGQSHSLAELIVELIPKNPIESATRAMDGDMLPFMMFAVIFGIALLFVKAGRTGDPLVRVIEGLRDVSMKIVDLAMALAPVGVAALMATLCFKFGFSLLIALSKYVVVVVLGLLVQQIIVYGGILTIMTRRNIFQFHRECRDVIFTAFSTASSTATLPLSLKTSVESLGLPKKISHFLLTVGASANQNGSALYSAVTVFFLAQVFGVDISSTGQWLVVVLSIISGIGTAGVPGGSLPMIVIILQVADIPPEAIGLVLGVDRFLDMCRSVVNVSGDLVAALAIANTEPKGN
jgi:dicarboxylate/amino acid:cation (Na+ or H+) symporter, DAACS family